MTTPWTARLKAAGLHFSLSLLVAALAAALVFGLWYPYPYREISGGRELFTLLVAVDVVLGPLLTFAIFNRAKPIQELRRDLAVVVLLQLAGLAYGMWSVYAARPVHLVFEIDRFRAVHAVDVPAELLDRTPPSVQALPWTGPTLLAVRPFRDERERVDATMAALQGLALGAQPDLWQPYEQARTAVLAAARPAAALRQRFPDRAAEIDAALAATGQPVDKLVTLPLAGRKSFWTVLLDAGDARVLGYVPLDSFCPPRPLTARRCCRPPPSPCSAPCPGSTRSRRGRCRR